MARGLPFDHEASAPSMRPMSAVTPSSTTVAALDAGAVPTLVNLVGSDGLEFETRAKLNALIAAHEELRVQFNDLVAKAQAAGQMQP